MSYGNLLHSIPEGLRSLYRKYESVSKKLIHTTWSIRFNTTCLEDDILPNYSRLRHHDQAVASTETTTKYRKYLVEREIACRQNKKHSLELEQKQLLRDIESFECNQKFKNPIDSELSRILSNTDNVVKARILKKLNDLKNGNNVNTDGNTNIKTNVNSFVNLSDYDLTNNEKGFLNLGLNCHLQPKYQELHKKTELEILYQNLLKLDAQKIITIKPNLADQLRAESTKHRTTKNQSMLPPSLREAARSLKDNDNITIRKADKSSIYAIMNKEEYISKLDIILADSSKFKRIMNRKGNIISMISQQHKIFYPLLML